jgi:hypothetical protein
LTLSAILEIIKGVLQFPSVVLEFVRLLQKTPQENHETLLKRITEEAERFEETGRPTWN